ncbi:MAG: right-handed parallel beta-helix repeat-containing protein, partial [Thermoplasmata archaeon]|nr:right-handed parallel beta-helix repeat-containing protein [Thermoplasmata archaeon]
IENNTISSNVPNSGGVYAYNSYNGDFSNNTVKGDAYDFKIYFDPFEIVNCTCDPSNTQAAIGGVLVAKNFLHLNVTDVNGPAPGVNITIKDNQDTIVFEGTTNKNGFIRYLKLTNQTVNFGGPTFYDPHNVTATSNGNIAYGEIEPTMNKSQAIKVIFNADLPPETPNNLRAVSNGTNVDLSWRPSHSPDLSHYLIYKNGTGSNWHEIYNTSNAPSPTSANWSDIMGASNSSTYFYKVLAVDYGFQKSNFSNIAKCGDWAVPDTRLISNLSVLLNGSLIILATGDLTLKNASLKFNNSYKVEFGIEVKPGGKLFIMDYDNNPLTTSDRSNISALDPDYDLYFIVNGSQFVMQNSKLSNCGSNDQLDYFSWDYKYAAPTVMSIGYPWTRGLYIDGDNVLIENNEFSDNFVAILINNTNNGKVIENTFSDNTFGVYLHNSEYNILKHNLFEDHEAFPIYLYDSGNNTLYSNNITNTLSYKPGIVLFNPKCHQNKILHNNISNGGEGIVLYKAGMNNNISFNNFYDLYWSILIERTEHSILLNNYFYNTGTYNLYLLYSDFTTVKGVKSYWAQYTIITTDSNNLIISDLEIENMSSYTIGLDGDNIKISNISIKSAIYGISISGGNIITITNITIEDCMFGIHSWNYPTNVKLHNSKIFKNTQEAIRIINCEGFIIDNCTFNATSLNFNLTNGIVTLYNTTYDQSKVKLDPSSSISLYWLLDVDVIDWFGNPRSNSNIQIRNVFGTLNYNGFTDPNGYVRWIWLLERTQYRFTNDTGNPYNVWASFSNHTGSTNLIIDRTTNTTVFLENILPMVSNVIITPLNPTTVSDLTVSYKYSDQEFDDEGNTIIKWYINGIYNDTFDDQITIDSSDTRKGQTWYCEIIPHDGDDYGGPLASPPVAVQNTPPEVSNVKIEELNPSSSDDLHINYTYFDIDNDPETRSTHRWLVNDGTGWKYSGNDVMILAWSETQKGELWKCEVTPGDGDDNGVPEESQIVIINNTAPEAFDLIIQPETPRSNETLEINYTYFDLDNDPESASIINWYKNGEAQFDLTGNFEVDQSLTSKGDSWHYIVTPFDGEDYGPSVNSTGVVIENTAPKVFNIVIEPDNPTTADDLTVIYEFYDEDGDSESYETIVEWLKWSGVEFTHTGLRVHTLSSSYTSKSEVWTCEITPHDNYVYGNTVRASISVTIENSVPTVSDFYITPINPTTKDVLSANYGFTDLDNELENGTAIQWYRNDEQIPELANKLTVSSNFTEKGQSWYFTVRPRDGFEFGEIAASEPVTIQNSAPTANNLTITPRFPLGDDKLVGSYIYFDPDGDNESTPEIKWYKDGEHQGIYDDKLEVEAEATGKGDNWYFTIRVYDGVDWSDEFRSYHVRVENSKPILNSISPAPGPIEINETESIEFFVDVIDPDGDFLNINWRENKVLTGSDVFHLFETDHQSAGDYEINLTIQDLGENSFTLSFEWAITVHNVNRLPQINIEEPLVNNPRVKEDSTLKFEITANDVDVDDTLKITWYLDDVIIPDSTGSTLNFRTTHANIGKRVIRVEVTDTYDTVDYSWNLTVEEETVELGPLGLEWDVWSIMIEVIVLSVTGLLAFIGYRKLRKKKGALKIYLEEIETISKLKDKAPEKYERKLTALEERINAEFKEGKIEDLHYLMLQEILAGHRGEHRRAEVTRKFRSLPQGITQNLDEMLKDGKITRKEYMAFAT